MQKTNTFDYKESFNEFQQLANDLKRIPYRQYGATVTTSSDNNNNNNLSTINPSIETTPQTPIAGVKIKHLFNDPFTPFSKLVCDMPYEAINKDYGPPTAYIDLLKANIGVGAIALLVGGLAAYFYVPSALAAGDTLAKIFNVSSEAGHEIINTIKALFVTSGAGENLCLGAYSVKQLIERYWDKLSPEEAYLINEFNISKEEKARRIARVCFDVIFTIGSAIPAFFIGRASGGGDAIATILAGLSAAANIPVNWLSIQQLSFKHDQALIDLARYNIANYLDAQLDALIQQPKETILNRMQKFSRREKHTYEDFAETFLELLTLETSVKKSKVVEMKQHNPTEVEVNIPEGEYVPDILGKPVPTIERSVFSTVTKAVVVPSSIGYIVGAFKDGASFGSNWIGFVCSAIVTIPYTALNYGSAKAVGDNLGSGKKTAADLAHPNYISRTSKVIGFASVFSGGTSGNASVTNLQFNSSTTSKVISYAAGVDSAAGAATVNGFFTNRLNEDLAVAQANHRGSPEVRKILHFLSAGRRIGFLIRKMTLESFMNIMGTIFNNKEKHPELYNTIFGILQTRMTGTQTHNFYKILESRTADTDNVYVPIKFTLFQPSYSTLPTNASSEDSPKPQKQKKGYTGFFASYYSDNNYEENNDHKKDNGYAVLINPNLGEKTAPHYHIASNDNV